MYVHDSSTEIPQQRVTTIMFRLIANLERTAATTSVMNGTFIFTSLSPLRQLKCKYDYIH